MAITVEKMVITPDDAREMLKFNVKNRKVRPGVVDRYSRDMVEGNWMLTHQGIAFDETGTLVDGQHRLLAICKANVPVEMMVTKGLPSGSLMIIDNNASRGFSDFMRWETDEPYLNARAVQSTARFIMTEMMHMDIPTAKEQMEFMHTYKPAMQFAYSMCNSYTNCKKAVRIVLAIAAGVCNIPLKSIFAFFGVINNNTIHDGDVRYNVKAAFDAKDWLNGGVRTHRADEAVLQKFFYLFYEDKRRVPNDFGNKIIYPITKIGLENFCKTLQYKAIEEMQK